jgi:hypothetical protein
MVTVYVPAHKPVAVAAFPPEGAQLYVYAPAGETVTEAEPLQFEQVAGTDDGVTVSAVVVGQVVHVVVLKYNPDTQRLKQSPPVLML